ncbi:metallo-beta-lactamase family protein [Acetivibrio thermocellus AD2]|jgi:metallo-beta-lactamase family protein|uniref:Metallo-beta-lactamase family protein n=1 Tax=Acetivibrio thermocellus AD2 TaxID=1138384 RepID=A0AB36TIC2_ACETH|nr:MBL fold metallo-hydrolase [Acetivibrio thermocellus]CDG35301.1 RNA-metabolizing metallo-beta-lactamase [Acetivibrio thermocellus BC1]ADU74679.1 RNA-metabolising metallo-beta-lactamase [Acetivibrio thermocellus DSM 1313]ALX08622.1 Beta-Casp domain containing protein [Acetivibrio thermocellus AD2]ANV76371.1 Beta-Casp domain containing protein [Acetivibrio thermocellus DSM 2360]EIC05562.1 RNA-metabolising metallo-beta-lactamase [Acetivibrio thermocellus YS]
MKITFLGAAKTVTGSCFFVETASTKFLVDCGMFQGYSKNNALNEEEFPFNVEELDYIFLTHAHIDHSGRIPRIYIKGFRGQIIATKATVELCAIMLPDSGHIQEYENEWTNRKRLRAGKPPVEPLYTYQDAVNCLELFRKVSYDEVIKINDEIRVRFRDAGHILGSAIIEMWINERGEEIKIVFSGDLGNKDIPILRDPSIIESADYLVIESTYGNRLHNERVDKAEYFLNLINSTIEKGGNVIIPSFAVGRTQELIYELNKKKEVYDEKLKMLFATPVYIDSPMAISATEVFRNNLDCYDEEAREYIENGDNPLDFPGLQFTRTAEESKALNERKESSIIIAASGMCEAGRIRHHLKHNLWRKDSTIIFVGYQAEGTLGRRLLDGAKKVRLFGEEISVEARIEMIEGFSGHADKEGLLKWIERFNRKPKKIFIVHGEEDAMIEFSEEINRRFNIETVIPSRGESFILNAHNVIAIDEKVRPDNSFRILQVVEKLENIKEEVEELSYILKSDLKQDKTDLELDELMAKLKNIEKSILEALK